MMNRLETLNTTTTTAVSPAGSFLGPAFQRNSRVSGCRRIYMYRPAFCSTRVPRRNKIVGNTGARLLKFQRFNVAPPPARELFFSSSRRHIVTITAIERLEVKEESVRYLRSCTAPVNVSLTFYSKAQKTSTYSILLSSGPLRSHVYARVTAPIFITQNNSRFSLSYYKQDTRQVSCFLRAQRETILTRFVLCEDTYALISMELAKGNG